MDLVNPFTEQVIFGKAFPRNVTSGTNVRVLRALVPTGRHVGHAQDLKHVSGPRSGGRAHALERYRGSHAGGVGKALAFAPTGMAAKASTGNGVKRGLGLIAAIPKPKKVPVAAPTPLRVRVARGKMKFGSAGSTGSRI